MDASTLSRSISANAWLRIPPFSLDFQCAMPADFYSYSSPSLWFATAWARLRARVLRVRISLEGNL